MSQRRRRGGVVAGILLTVLILGVLAVAALVATGVYIARNVRVTERSARGETTVETPFGTVRVRDSSRLDLKHLGLPIYPGAMREEDSRKLASFNLDFGDKHAGLYVAAAEYRTPDPIDKVTAYYRQQLPHWLFSESGDCGIKLELTERGYKKIVAIHREDGETRIGLASVGEPASN
jgi:hypothetical protein